MQFQVWDFRIFFSIWGSGMILNWQLIRLIIISNWESISLASLGVTHSVRLLWLPLQVLIIGYILYTASTAGALELSLSEITFSLFLPSLFKLVWSHHALLFEALKLTGIKRKKFTCLQLSLV